MKEYLQVRKERFESAKSAQIGCLVLLIIFFVLVSIGFFTVDQIDGLSEFAIVFIIVALFILAIGIFLNKLRLRKAEVATLKIIITFLKKSGSDNIEIIDSINNIFSIYSLKNTNKHIESIEASKVDINEACRQLMNQSVDIKFFLLYTLLDIAAYDSILTIDQENFITRIRKGINIHEITYNNIKNNYLKQGLKEERQIIEEQNRKRAAEIFSKSFLPYNAYKILGVSPSVTKAQLKKVYRTLAKKYHPDKFHGQSEEIIQKAEDKFQKILEAYEIVKEYKKL